MPGGPGAREPPGRQQWKLTKMKHTEEETNGKTDQLPQIMSGVDTGEGLSSGPDRAEADPGISCFPAVCPEPGKGAEL